MEVITFENEEKWLAFRKNRIGASDAPIIMRVAKWKTNDGRIKTPNLLWQEKLGLSDLSSDNAATRYGRLMEDPARNAYQEMVGDLFIPAVTVNAKYPHLMASLDGLNFTQDKAVEIKNANRDDHELAKQGIVPPKYYPQVMQQLLVTEFDEIDYFSFHKEQGIKVKVLRNEEYLKKLEAELYKFWEYVLNLKEPPLTEDDFIEMDNAWAKNAKELFEIKQMRKDLEKKEDLLEDRLKELSQKKNSRSGGYRYVCNIVKGSVNYTSIPELVGVNLDKYRKEPVKKWSLIKE